MAYYLGQGVPQDHKEAVKWYRKAAEQGDADAHYHLGNPYKIGAGVPEDYIHAYAWFNVAAANEDKGEETQSELAHKMTKEQIAKAQDLSQEMIEANPKLIN